MKEHDLGDESSWPKASEWLAMNSGASDALVVRGFPLAAGSVSTASYDLAPKAIRDRLARLSTYDSLHDIDLLSVPVRDEGEDSIGGELLAPLTVILGGHNAVTFHVLSSVEDLSSWGLLTFDAHHDVRPYEPGAVGNGSPVRALIDAGLQGSNIVQIGINGFSNSRNHRRWCEVKGVTVCGPSELSRVDIHLSLLARKCSAIYVDIDMDVLDRSFAPGCPGSRPGGAAPAALFEAAYRSARAPKVRAIDIVEVDPASDVGSITVDSAALTLLNVASGYGSRWLNNVD